MRSNGGGTNTPAFLGDVANDIAPYGLDSAAIPGFDRVKRLIENDPPHTTKI